MSSKKPIGERLNLLLLSFFVLSITNIAAQDGKAIFQSKCASCHILGRDATGPNLTGVIGRWGGNMDQLHTWVKNWSKAVEAGYPEAVNIVNFSSGAMTKFEGVLTDPDIDAVLKYVDAGPIVATKGGGPGDTSAAPANNSNAVIFGVISLILGIIALILLQVNSNLKKMSDDVEGISRPEAVPFYRNKIYIAMISLLFFVVGGFFVSKGAIGLNRQVDYQPEQPIYYSHRVHAGVNQINCLYCHGSAMDSKHAAIPSVNVCMNCHKTISSYEKGPKLYDEDGNEIDGTYQIAQLYKYAGFDPKKPNDWNATMAKPIEWVKIHNLPDHVYFNHSQHVKAGNVQCQTCHGEITAMDEVKQVSELSMGWCVNCHRETKVNFNYTDSTGNQFYSIYEKFHNDIRNHKMDSVTVKDIGGLECQKCHY
jgi:cytochrome c2